MVSYLEFSFTNILGVLLLFSFLNSILILISIFPPILSCLHIIFIVYIYQDIIYILINEIFSSLSTDNDPCLLCGSPVVDEFRFGKKYKHEEIVAHYYCLLFSCGLEQNGKDEEGILGFLKKDILKEASRGKRLKCSFCRKNGATSACCLKQCRVMFHLGCGIEAKCLNQFYQDFS